MSDALHNPERHGQERQGRARLWCECGSWCSENALCDCCELVELRAEVERLTQRNAALERVRELARDEIHTLRAEVERLTVELADRDQRIEAALAMLDAELKFERNMGTHLSLTQISDTLRGDQ